LKGMKKHKPECKGKECGNGFQAQDGHWKETLSKLRYAFDDLGNFTIGRGGVQRAAQGSRKKREGPPGTATTKLEARVKK